MYFILFTLLTLTHGHVRLLYSDTEFVLGNRPIRNANSPTGDGKASVSGACGGNQAWGANSFSTASPGDQITIKFNYGADHDSSKNLLSVRWQCGSPTKKQLEDSADVACTSLRCPVPGAYPCPATDAQITNGYVFRCQVPQGASGDCTYSVLDQRNWGGCLDIKVAAAVVPGTGTGPVTQPPEPAVSLSELSGDYNLGHTVNHGSCLLFNATTEQGCCCKVANGWLNIGEKLSTPGTAVMTGMLNFQCPIGSRFDSNGLPSTGFPFDLNDASGGLLLEKIGQDVKWRGTVAVRGDFKFEFVLSSDKIIQYTYNNPLLLKGQLIADGTISMGGGRTMTATSPPSFDACSSFAKQLTCINKLEGNQCKTLVNTVGCSSIDLQHNTPGDPNSKVQDICCETCASSSATLFLGLATSLWLLFA